MRTSPSRLAVSLCTALVLLAASRNVDAQSTPDVRLDSMFSRYTREQSPGLALAVTHNGRMLTSKGYGYADLEHRVAITPDTPFDVASVSKQFAGLAIAMLVKQGRVRLGDDIRRYIPELQYAGSPITIDHLVHHTSGLRDWPGSLALAGWQFDDVISFEQILGFAYHQRTLNFTPGAEYTYSNTGYNLLAELVRRVTGQTFRQWTDEHLFRPLGMNDSHFRDDRTALIPNRALGYARTPAGTFRNVGNELTAVGSSSLYSSVNDLAKWVLNFDEPKVGGADAMTLMRTRGVLNDGSSIPYAFGVSHGEYRGQPTVSHSGGWASFATYLVHFPKQKFGVVVLANSGVVNPTRAAFDIADLYLDSALAPRTATPAAPATAVVSSARLDRYAGLYRLGPGWYVRVRRDGAALKARATREDEFLLSPRSDSSFWVAAYNAPMTFEPAPEPAGVQLLFRGRRYPRSGDAPSYTTAQLAPFTGVYESDELRASYQVEVDSGALVMRHPRHGTIRLTQLWKDDFGGSLWFTRSVEFQRDERGAVTGFAVFVDERSRNIRFVRRRP